MACIVSYLRALVSETFPWPTCARRSKISGQIAENFGTDRRKFRLEAVLGWRELGVVEDVFLQCYENWSEVGIPTSQPLAKKRAAVLLMPGRWRGRVALLPGRWRARVEASMPGRWRGSAGWRLRCRAGAAGTKPPNPHSPPGPCYTSYTCYMALTRQAAEPSQSPGSLLYVLYELGQAMRNFFRTQKSRVHPRFFAFFE